MKTAAVTQTATVNLYPNPYKITKNVFSNLRQPYALWIWITQNVIQIYLYCCRTNSSLILQYVSPKNHSTFLNILNGFCFQIRSTPKIYKVNFIVILSMYMRVDESLIQKSVIRVSFVVRYVRNKCMQFMLLNHHI